MSDIKKKKEDKDRVQMSYLDVVAHGNWWAVAWSETYRAEQQLTFLQQNTNRIRTVNVS